MPATAVNELIYLIKVQKNHDNVLRYLSDFISNRARVGWTTHKHTGIDMNLYASGKYSDKIRGN